VAFGKPRSTEGAEDTCVSVAAEVADLVKVFDPTVQICRHPRPRDLSITSELSLDRSPPTAGFRRIVDLERQADPIDFDVLRHCPRLHADLAWLIELYADLLECPAIGVRFEVMQRAMCPAFHVDRTGIRLLCTYGGEGTQWVDDAGLDAAARRAAQEHPSPNRLGQANPFDILLLKGSLWHGNETRGAIHRSPPMRPDAGTRYLVALDAIWSTRMTV
jgi:hypothetical protein